MNKPKELLYVKLLSKYYKLHSQAYFNTIGELAFRVKPKVLPIWFTVTSDGVWDTSFVSAGTCRIDNIIKAIKCLKYPP